MIKPWQLRAIREAAGWSQGRLAEKAGLTQPVISALEKGQTKNPSTNTIAAIQECFEKEGWFFTDNGIERKTTRTYQIEGEDCYLKLLQIAQESGEKEFLKSGADERRSSDEVIAQLEEMRKTISMRSLIKDQDKFFMGEANEYRWLPPALYVKGDVKVIFGSIVAYLVTWSDEPHVIVVDDEVISEEARRSFDYIWNNSEQPSESIAPRRFSDVKS